MGVGAGLRTTSCWVASGLVCSGLAGSSFFAPPPNNLRKKDTFSSGCLVTSPTFFLSSSSRQSSTWVSRSTFSTLRLHRGHSSIFGPLDLSLEEEATLLVEEEELFREVEDLASPCSISAWSFRAISWSVSICSCIFFMDSISILFTMFADGSTSF